MGGLGGGGPTNPARSGVGAGCAGAGCNVICVSSHTPRWLCAPVESCVQPRVRYATPGLLSFDECDTERGPRAAPPRARAMAVYSDDDGVQVPSQLPLLPLLNQVCYI